RVSGAGMSSREGGAAEASIVGEAASVRAVDLRGALHVAELSDVGVEAVGARPAEEDVAGRLHDSLTDNDALPLVSVRGPPRVGREHRRLGLLDLEKEGVEIGDTGEQDDEAACAHAADAHDLQ